MLFFSYWNFYFHFCAIFFIPLSLFLIYYLIFFISLLPFFFCVKHYSIAFIFLKLIFICLPLSLTLPFSFFLNHNYSLFSFISLHRLLLLLVSSIILGSLLTLSSFTRFSLYCLHPASRIFLPILTLLPPSLSPYLLPRPLNSLSLSPSLSLSLSFFLHRSFSHVTWSYIFVLLFGIASIHLSFPLFSSRFTLIDRDRTSRCRRRGWTRTDWWRLSSAARGCKKRGVANHVVVGASIVTVLNKQP